jgi:hypothetical protein
MLSLWEILVPKKLPQATEDIDPAFHQEWDARVRIITGGLTILHSARGQWVSPDGELESEKMIPVRIMCTEENIERIADITAKHYTQKAVMFYKVAETVRVKHYPVVA